MLSVILLLLTQAPGSLSSFARRDDSSRGVGGVTYIRPNVPNRTYTTTPPRYQEHHGGALKADKPLDIARSFVMSHLGVPRTGYTVKNNYQSTLNNVTHIYLRQIVDGLEVFNGDINLNINHQGQVISYGSSFYREPTQGRGGAALLKRKFPRDAVAASRSMEALLDHLRVQRNESIVEAPRDFSAGNDHGQEVEFANVPGAIKPARAKVGWMQLDDGSLEPVWDHKLELPGDYFHSHVSARTNQLVSLVNWVSRAMYNVVPFGTNDPSEGKRRLLTDPYDKVASPLGWHDTGKIKTTNTGGNNAYAVKVGPYDKNELKAAGRVDGGERLKFSFKFNDKKDQPKQYKSASVTNLFYYTNMIHDLYYRFGFDEVAGNFQETNFDRGGAGEDAVISYAQDPSSTNNAFFSTPPDGEHGRMMMYIFDELTPNRDGAFDSGIMIHEYTHGLSNRLTGGPSNVDCLADGEPGGLGEGWGDMVATMIRMKPEDTRASDKGTGKYVMGRETIRKFMYSTNLTTNPETYEFLDHEGYDEVHNMGALWANMLYEVYWNLWDKLGATEDWFGEGADRPAEFGNTLLLRLLIDGMKLQPCNPSFLDARDAIVQAESLLTNGAHACALWQGFAKRGLGLNAKVILAKNDTKTHKNSFDLPLKCK